MLGRLRGRIRKPLRDQRDRPHDRVVERCLHQDRSLNEHYREVVALARLILRHSSFETDRGGIRAPGFLIDMNRVFQDFVTQALREDLQVSDRVFRSDDRVPNADLYQLLAYATALALPGGLLIYAQGEAEPAAYRVRHAGKRLEIAALDLSGTIDDLLARIGALAQRIRLMRMESA